MTASFFEALPIGMNTNRSLLLKTRRALVEAFACALAAFFPSCASAGDSYQWVQYGPGGPEARAVTQNPSCPPASIDGRDAAMTPRAQPDGAFPIRVCSLQIPRGAKDATVDGRRLALPGARVDKILLIGDTGCRLKIFLIQDCNSSEAWPFRTVAETGAARAPDLVVHLGDYYYRESPCPWTRKGCAGSPWGDDWDAWKADFFDPARALLDVAPWVFVRGNHEVCERGGHGWSRTLDAYPFAADAGCREREQAFAVDLGELTLVVIDASEADEPSANEEQAEFYKSQFASVGALKGPVWLAFHKPVFASARVSGKESRGDNKTLALAARNATPPNVQAILSGHQHVFQIVSYVEDFPAQIVVGNSGDMLLLNAPAEFDGLVIDGVTVERGRGVPGVFGFAMLERGADEWLVTDYDIHGKVMARCRLRGRKVECE